MLSLTGTAIADGVTIGQVHRLVPDELTVPQMTLTSEKARQSEIERLRRARDSAAEQLQQQQDRTDNPTALEVLGMHRQMLLDPALLDDTIATIQQENCNAEWALVQVQTRLVEQLNTAEDDYLRARTDDIEHVIRLLHSQLQDSNIDLADRLPKRLQDIIVVAADPSPAEMVLIKQRGASGLVTEHGSAYSHTAIMARGLNLPTVLAVPEALSMLKENEMLLLDGHHGALFAEPDEAMQQHYQQKAEAYQRHLEKQQALRRTACQTHDGVAVKLFANIEQSADIQATLEAGAAGVGLLRSELLFLQQPAGLIDDEQQQYECYAEMAEALQHDGKPLPLTVRTLDVGSDKPLPQTADDDGWTLDGEPNPALGLRGIRFSLRYPQWLKIQLRALLRASRHGQIRILLPMISMREELLSVRRLLQECLMELQAEERSGLTPGAVPIGAMIETPAAALALQDLLPLVDFIAIGSNDLVQYTLAIDRRNDNIARWYAPRHPAIVSLLASIITTARQNKKPVSVCGELASDPDYVPLLLGMGLREFSVHPGRLLSIKQVMSELDAAECTEQVRALLQHGSH